ncbi:hypothetical protein CUN91_00210 [Candidatus Carsonella ruddii]|uniref:Obg domain-containing protein n=1 Tax=Carsonella ruddii TaxID=114186 RepID=A0A2K8K453_CARRU|nr:hypothetical protein [Candidatus Carsonella ruddii]ATX33379.1 hypothetical protein CUN91_00210 [Candidatus Carsonella ruddii]
MFIEKYLLLKSGKGGNGCISYKFLNGKFYANGGDGGDGGDLYLLSNNNFKLPNNNLFISKNGKNGEKNNKKGKKGKDLIIKISLGVIITLNKKKIYIVKNNYFIKILKGGKGGNGNFCYKNFYNSKIANFGKQGKIIFIKINFKYFYYKCYINISENFLLNNFNYKNNFISKIYIFYINLLFFKIFFKLIKFFLYFLYIKNLNNINYWIIIDGIENVFFFSKIKKINLIITPYFMVSSVFNLGYKKFFHFLKLWKNC